VTVTDLPTGRPESGHPPLRHRPAPCTEPPYEAGCDDTAAPADHGPSLVQGSPVQGNLVQGTLALSFELPSGRPAAPPPALRLVDGSSAADEETDAGEFGPQPTTSAALPAARAWAGRVVQAIVEVLGGARPVGQLVRWTSAEVYDEIAALVVPGTGPEYGPPRAVVRSVHVAEPSDGVAEVCALVRRGARSTAVALRLEGRDGRWQCTALELG